MRRLAATVRIQNNGYGTSVRWLQKLREMYNTDTGVCVPSSGWIQLPHRDLWVRCRDCDKAITALHVVDVVVLPELQKLESLRDDSVLDGWDSGRRCFFGLRASVGLIERQLFNV